MTEADVIMMFEYFDKMILLNEVIIYLMFVIIGGLIALGFFKFWRDIVK